RVTWFRSGVTCRARSTAMIWSIMSYDGMPLASPLKVPIGPIYRNSPLLGKSRGRDRPREVSSWFPALGLPSEKLQHRLGALVGLRQHRRTRLGEDVVLRELSHLLRHVYVA